MPLDIAALMGCAVLTGIGSVTDGAEVKPGSIVVVLGCGGVGLNVIQGARLAGAARIIAVDLNPAKLELAQTFGATDTVAGGDDAVEKVIELTKGGADYAFEVVGSPAVQRQACMMLRKRGTLMLVGIPKSGSEFSAPALVIITRELRVIGSLMGSVPFQNVIPKYAQLYLDGRLTLDPLISHRIKLDDINKGYEQLIAGETARSVITFDH
jgi:S-(hydroxymethyl)glutathione dehydrogenase/alcohol dehydrogenase